MADKNTANVSRMVRKPAYRMIKANVLAAVFLSLASLVVQAQVQSQYTLQFSHMDAPDTLKARAAEDLAKRVNKRLKGRLTMRVYPGGQLYSDKKIMDLMRFNTGQTGLMAAPSVFDLTKLSRPLHVFELPFLFKNIKDVHTLLDSAVAEKITRPLERKGIKALSFWDRGMKVFTVRGDAPLRTLSHDFSGKKFAVLNSGVYQENIRALGGVPLPMPSFEVYAALDQGMANGQDSAWSNIRDRRLFEVQDYFTVSDHAYSGFLLVISHDFWGTLPADIQHELTAAVNETTAKVREWAAQAEADDKAAIIAAKGEDKVLVLSEQQRELWRKASRQVEAKFSRRIGLDLLEDIHTLLDQH